MRTYRDAKRMARNLASSLREKNFDVSHGESLDIVARQFGLSDWNTLSARLKQAEMSDARRTQALQAWDFVGGPKDEFDHGVDRNARGDGRRAAVIRRLGPGFGRLTKPAQAFGTLAQTVSAVPYHGQRLEISADLATELVSHGATVWARVDKAAGHVLAFDNLKDHPCGWLFGDNGWTRRSVVLDVPTQGVTLQFGFFLKGAGAVWAAGFGLKVVGTDIALTSQPSDPEQYEAGWIKPENLDFSTVVDLVF